MKKILSYQAIIAGIESGDIIGDKNLVQPCSLDFAIYRDISISAGETVIVDLPVHKIDSYVSAKSTMARCGVSMYARDNKLYLTSLCFDIVLLKGESIAQFIFLGNDDCDLSTKTTVNIDFSNGWIANHDSDRVLICSMVRQQNNHFRESGQIHTLETRKFYLLKSKEEISIPHNMCGVLRQNPKHHNHIILHTGAGFIDTGFRGHLVFEVTTGINTPVNQLDYPIVIDLIPLTEATQKPYNGNYQGQSDLNSILPKYMKG